MSPIEKRLLLLFSIIVGLTRFFAIARSLNDWDEALFSLGVAEYDVNEHHPHPPGYPLFIVAAKAIAFFGVNEFRSLQVIVVLGAMLLFPMLVLFARECGFDFTTAVCGALIFVFLPNVWVYGGTAFSDIPSTALGIAACWLLLAGRRSGRMYLLGAIVLGIAAGVRIPNLLIGAAPALIATIHRLRARDFRNVIAAVLLGGAITGGSYLGAALASGTIDEYRYMMYMQSKYVREVDSWRSPTRPPLHNAAKTFFAWPIFQKVYMASLATLALIGIGAAFVRRRWSLLLVIAVFGPFMLLAWLNLDIHAAGRYAIAYLALHALFAAHALEVIGRKKVVQVLLAVAVVLTFAIETWPALRLQRTSDAPVAAAMGWVQRNVPENATVYVFGGLWPQQQYLLRGRKTFTYVDTKEISRIRPDTWIVEPRILEGAHNFVWPRGALWDILRRRNFEASVLRLASLITFGEGWYPMEEAGTGVFRWTAKEARASLPAMPNRGRLSMRIYVPIDAIAPPTIEVRVNGAVVERFAGNQALMDKSWTIESRKSGANELVISTSEAVVPGNGDPRALGLRIDAMSWMPAP